MSGIAPAGAFAPDVVAAPAAPDIAVAPHDALNSARRFCTAPMMSYSHKHARRLWRLLCPPALIYTEMIMAQALTRGFRLHLLDRAPLPAPLALQLGGNDPATMAAAAKIGEDAGYAEVNINCGCPSPKVKKAAFGACLMQTPALVADIVAAMKAAVKIAVTVKCRIAVDGTNDEEDLDAFTRAVEAAGCDALIVHARRALLTGLNPAQNRSVPPLNHARVRRLKAAFKQMPVVLNGGVETPDEASALLRAADGLPGLDGVMVGRAICKHPYMLAEAARRFFGATAPSKRDVLGIMREYVAALPEPERRWAVSALSGLYRGEANSRHYRRALQLGEVPIPASFN